MSRSRRKTPVCGNTCAKTEKQDKRIANRKLRRVANSKIAAGFDVLPVMRDVSSSWTMDKDGKQRFDPERHPALMRK